MDGTHDRLHGGELSFSFRRLYHLTLLVLSFYCLIALLIAERRAENPMLPLLPFRNSVFSSAIASNEMLHMTMLGIFFLTPASPRATEPKRMMRWEWFGVLTGAGGVVASILGAWHTYAIRGNGRLTREILERVTGSTQALIRGTHEDFQALIQTIHEGTHALIRRNQEDTQAFIREM